MVIMSAKLKLGCDTMPYRFDITCLGLLTGIGIYFHSLTSQGLVAHIVLQQNLMLVWPGLGHQRYEAYIFFNIRHDGLLI